MIHFVLYYSSAVKILSPIANAIKKMGEKYSIQIYKNTKKHYGLDENSEQIKTNPQPNGFVKHVSLLP